MFHPCVISSNNFHYIINSFSGKQFFICKQTRWTNRKMAAILTSFSLFINALTADSNAQCLLRFSSDILTFTNWKTSIVAKFLRYSNQYSARPTHAYQQLAAQHEFWVLFQSKLGQFMRARTCTYTSRLGEPIIARSNLKHPSALEGRDKYRLFIAP